MEKDGVGRMTFGQQYNLMADFLFFPSGESQSASDHQFVGRIGMQTSF